MRLLFCEGKSDPAGAFTGHTQTSEQGSRLRAGFGKQHPCSSPYLLQSNIRSCSAGTRGGQCLLPGRGMCRTRALRVCPASPCPAFEHRGQASAEPQLPSEPRQGDSSCYRAANPGSPQPPRLLQEQSEPLADPGPPAGPPDSGAVIARQCFFSSGSPSWRTSSCSVAGTGQGGSDSQNHISQMDVRLSVTCLFYSRLSFSGTALQVSLQSFTCCASHLVFQAPHLRTVYFLSLSPLILKRVLSRHSLLSRWDFLPRSGNGGCVPCNLPSTQPRSASHQKLPCF